MKMAGEAILGAGRASLPLTQQETQDCLGHACLGGRLKLQFNRRRVWAYADVRGSAQFAVRFTLEVCRCVVQKRARRTSPSPPRGPQCAAVFASSSRSTE